MADENKPSFLSRWSQRKAQARTVEIPSPAAGNAASMTVTGTEAETATGAKTPRGAAKVLGETQAAQPAASAPGELRSVAGSPGAVVAETSAKGTDPGSGYGTERAALPTMEDVAQLSGHSDYSRFVQPGVEARVRNAAMRKLFADPHFNVMDGLDIYIDDYSLPDPIPPAMLRMMTQSKSLGLFDDEDAAQEGLSLAATPPSETPAPGSAGADGPDSDDSSPAAGAPQGPATAGSAPASDDAARGDNPAHHDHTDLQLQPDDATRRRGAGEGAWPGEV